MKLLKAWLKSGCGLASPSEYTFQFLPLLFADQKSSTKLPAFSGAIMNMEESAIQRAPGPAPVSSSEMLKVGETVAKEPQDR